MFTSLNLLLSYFCVGKEGIHFLLPHITKRKILVGDKDFVTCMSGEQKVIPLANFSDDFNASVKDLSSGPMIVILDGHENDFTKKMMLVMWRCRSEAVNCLVSKAEMEGMKTKLTALVAE